MRYLVTIMCFVVSSFVLANDTIKISIPVENIAVEITKKGECEFYVKVANSFYKTDKASYLKIREALQFGMTVYVSAIVDEKNRVIRIIA